MVRSGVYSCIFVISGEWFARGVCLINWLVFIPWHLLGVSRGLVSLFAGVCQVVFSVF